MTRSEKEARFQDRSEQPSYQDEILRTYHFKYLSERMLSREGILLCIHAKKIEKIQRDLAFKKPQLKHESKPCSYTIRPSSFSDASF